MIYKISGFLDDMLKIYKHSLYKQKKCSHKGKLFEEYWNYHQYPGKETKNKNDRNQEQDILIHDD